MKKISPKLLAVLGGLALLLIGFAVFGAADGLSLLALPFTLLGKGLRTLSLTGKVGNIAAIALYAAVALLPLAPLLRGGKKREDILLVLCSALLFYVIYFMVNPALRPIVLQNEVGDVILSGVVYSALVSWAVVKLMHHCGGMGTEQVYRALRIFLGICAAELLLGIAVKFSGCLADMEAIRAANTMPGLDLMPTFVFVVLSFVVTALEYGMSISVLLPAMKLLRRLETDPYGDDCGEVACKVAGRCKCSLVVVTLSGLALQIAQVFSASLLYNLAVSFRFPVVNMAIAFALLALTRLLSQGKQLKDDNDLFI